MNWYVEPLKKYATFTGRAGRREYWYFVLINLPIILTLMGIDAVTGTLSEKFGYGILSGIYVLALTIPGLAVYVRRLHDTNHSGWWVLFGLIPIVGIIIIFIFLVKDSDAGENRYGPNPKGISGIDAGMPV